MSWCSIGLVVRPGVLFLGTYTGDTPAMCVRSCVNDGKFLAFWWMEATGRGELGGIQRPGRGSGPSVIRSTLLSRLHFASDPSESR